MRHAPKLFVKLHRCAVIGGTAAWAVACSPADQDAGPGKVDERWGSNIAVGSAQARASSNASPAFSNAVGYGAISQGGRNGRIIQVTNLNDSGAGSLRACITASGPRVCVFRVGGVIRFTGRPPYITNPFITIAGQTAPGGGITLAHSGGANGRTPLVIRNTHNVIIRHIRVRNDRIGVDPNAEDSITIEKSSRVIVDHVSASWARDELVNGFADNDHITVSNSIFAYGVPPHDKCALLGSDPTDRQNFSFIGNICAHNGDRNPDVNFPPASCVEVINNVLYNADFEFAEIWESYGGTPVALVGNAFIAGQNTSPEAVGITRNTVGSTGAASIYMNGNSFSGQFVHVTPAAAAVQRDTPPCPLTITPKTAAQAYSSVLATAGAWPRDAVDARVVSEVKSRGGRIVAQPGAIPPVQNGTPYPDVDRDGLDDNWETSNGANPALADPWADANGNGISNLEEFLDYLDAKLVPQP
jgi:pectate lyase